MSERPLAENRPVDQGEFIGGISLNKEQIAQILIRKGFVESFEYDDDPQETSGALSMSRLSNFANELYLFSQQMPEKRALSRSLHMYHRQESYRVRKDKVFGGTILGDSEEYNNRVLRERMEDTALEEIATAYAKDKLLDAQKSMIELNGFLGSGMKLSEEWIEIRENKVTEPLMKALLGIQVGQECTSSIKGNKILYALRYPSLISGVRDLEIELKLEDETVLYKLKKKLVGTVESVRRGLNL